MDPERPTIAILYSHALLGEGLGRLLATEPDVDIRSASVGESERVEELLAARPDMVVMERSAVLDPLDLLRRSPDSLVIDIAIGPGPTWVYRRQEIPGDSDAILRLIRRLRGGHPVISLDPAVGRGSDEDRRPDPDPDPEGRVAVTSVA